MSSGGEGWGCGHLFPGKNFFPALELVIAFFTNLFTIVPMFNSIRFPSLNFLVFVCEDEEESIPLSSKRCM